MFQNVATLLYMVQMLVSNNCKNVGIEAKLISWYSNNSHVSVAATLKFPHLTYEAAELVVFLV